MVKAPKITGNKGLIWAAWLLSTAGFAILLGGVASMQQSCGSGLSNVLTGGGGGSVGYLAPVSCNHLFQYTWWISFFHFFTWFLVAAYLLMNVIHKSRPALTGILAVAAVLLMDTANTYLAFNYIPGLTSTMAKRTRTTVAGAAIAAAADLLLILLIGWHDTTTTVKERGDVDYREEARYTTTPVAGTTTTTTTAPGTMPTAV
jgi:preprotein translocase subunit SecG